jgi:transposase
MAQRKVDDNIVLQLLKEGKNQKQIAEHFKVSPVAICKRLKRILPKPQSLEKLTDKEQKFVVAVAEGKSRTQAVMDSFDVSTRASAKAMQSVLMQKDDVKIAIAEMMEIYGLTRGYRINKLKSHVDHVDPSISLKAIDQSWKLDGSYAAEKHTVEVDYKTVTMEIKQIDIEITRLEDELKRLTGTDSN